MANEFNSFFVNIGPNLAENITCNLQSKDIIENKNWISHSMYLSDVTENDILTTVYKLKNKTSKDSDGIDMKLIKMTIDCVVKPLHHIFNLSLKLGIFPEKMKIAKVIPFFKNGDRHTFNNYRPVSLLSQFSKVLEKLFVNKLDSFIEKNKLLSENQFGFRSNRSTDLAIMKIVEEISTAIDKKKYTIGVFMDLKKAFDTIDHSILISKLYAYGVRGIALNWITSYLKNRQQYVQFGGKKSDLMNIICGLPQGSIVGPKLFILYINDICDISKLLQFVLFADDTNFFCSGDNLKTLAKSIEMEMIKLKMWFDYNKLSLNLTKTKFMVFGNKNRTEVTLSIDNIKIEQVSEFKFLGVMLDDKLTWKSHIFYVKNKVAKSLFVLNKSKYVLPCHIMHMLYCSLVLPYFTYCIEVWGNTYETNIMPLILLQKRAIRIIHKANFRDHTNDLFIKSGLLKLKNLIELQTLLVMFKARNRDLPEDLQKLFIFTTGDENHRRKYDFKQQIARTTLKQKCLSIAGVKMWNSQENQLKSCQNIIKFKRMYKAKQISLYKLDC
uniref:Reverse transcriptase domain-containing protein n=1 Tax=Oryzias latipes TaxID=8090 RepID=A0A3B3IP09_ORYLA